MNKKNNLALFALLIVGLFSLSTIYIFAQKTESVKGDPSPKQCSGEKFVMPSSIAVGSDAFENFLRIAALPMAERKKSFSKLSSEQKANFIKVNLALQFVKRPNTTKEQQDFVLDSISNVSVETFDKSDPEKVRQSEKSGIDIVNKAFGLFPHREAGDFIEPLNTNKNEEIAILRKYEEVLKLGMTQRKRHVRAMPMPERVEIWKVQLAYHLATGKFSKI